MAEKIKFTLRSKDIAERAKSILNELKTGNITPPMISDYYYKDGIIPPYLGKTVEGTLLFAEQAALWAATGRGLFLCGHGIKQIWIGRVLRLAVPAAYGKLSSKLAPFSDIEVLWDWLKANTSWGKLIRYLIDSGIEIGEEEHQLPLYIAHQADKGSV